MERDLFAAVEFANSFCANVNGTQVAASIVPELLELHDAGSLDDLDRPLERGRCSFVEPRKDGEDVEEYSRGSVPLSWDGGCGRVFGSEFVFGRTLELEMDYDVDFEMVKNARGGSRINEWIPSGGVYWEELRKTIASRRGAGNAWKALVWHQGENDVFTFGEEDDTTATYLGNLTALVAGVRSEMMEASETDAWRCPEQIPVVVVQIGAWPGREGGKRVKAAQKQFARNDPRAALVRTEDLSPFYHFDAASFLVMGRRIARAYEEVARTSREVCPGDLAAVASPTSELV
ncbi:hypothetical protein ACHAWF_004652 [Thalassiosira exigua]